MSKAPDMDGNRRYSKPTADKSTFMQTCNLLSKFMKENRFAGETSKGVGAKLEHRACSVMNKTAKSMNLLTNKDSSNDSSKEIAAAMDFLPQLLHNSSNKESDSREKDQLTIFYCGKVLVFNDFGAENATEIMEMATKLSSDNTVTEDKTQTSAPVPPSEAKNIALPGTDSINTEQEGPRTGSQASGSNLKIARRASLHKFFEKRKERVTARGPYPLNNAVITSSKPAGESSSGPSDADHARGQSSKELDLKL